MEGAGNRKFSILSNLEEEQKVEIGASMNPGNEESKQGKSNPKDEETKLADSSPKRPIKIIGKIYYHY